MLRFYARLNDVEVELVKQDIAWCFVRIHKSYLVNQYYIARVDKHNHAVHLTSGLSQSYLHLNMRTKSHIYHGIRGTSSN